MREHTDQSNLVAGGPQRALSGPHAPGSAASARAPADVLRTHALVKRFDKFVAVDGLDLRVRAGECFGLLGPNGAGKSTTLKLLLGLMQPTSGTIELLGHPVPRAARAARARVGVVPQHDALDPDFTAAENLAVFGRYFGLSARNARARVEPLLEFAGLAAKRDAKISELSGGMKRRLTIARALVNDPEVLFLDEPTTGLDPRSRFGLWDVIRDRVREGITLLLTTQYLEEADALAHSIAVVDHGRIIARGTADQLKAQVGGERIEVVVHARADVARAAALLAADGGAGDCTVDEHTRRLTIPAHGGAQRLVQVVRDFDTAHIPIDDISLRRPTLDDVFLALTGHSAEQPSAKSNGSSSGTIDDARPPQTVLASAPAPASSSAVTPTPRSHV